MAVHLCCTTGIEQHSPAFEQHKSQITSSALQLLLVAMVCMKSRKILALANPCEPGRNSSIDICPFEVLLASVMQEIRQLLYSMLKGGFINVTDIPKTADRAASRTFYTWRVRQDKVSEKLGLDVVHSMFNIASRLQKESLLNLEVRFSDRPEINVFDCSLLHQ